MPKLPKHSADVWAEYDALPPSEKTGNRLGTAYLEACGGEGSRNAALQDLNAREARSRMPEMLAIRMKEKEHPPRAEGSDLDVLVTSDDPTKGLLWGSSWSNTLREDLKLMGFKEVRCSTKSWKL